MKYIFFFFLLTLAGSVKTEKINAEELRLINRPVVIIYDLDVQECQNLIEDLIKKNYSVITAKPNSVPVITDLITDKNTNLSTTILDGIKQIYPKNLAEVMNFIFAILIIIAGYAEMRSLSN